MVQVGKYKPAQRAAYRAAQVFGVSFVASTRGHMYNLTKYPKAPSSAVSPSNCSAQNSSPWHHDGCDTFRTVRSNAVVAPYGCILHVSDLLRLDTMGVVELEAPLPHVDQLSLRGGSAARPTTCHWDEKSVVPHKQWR